MLVMFEYIKEFFDEYIESWKEVLNPESETNKKLDEEMKKGNIVFIPIPFTIIPIHKSWISHMAKEAESFLLSLKESASSLFNDWLEGWKIMDEICDDPEKFMKAYIKNLEKDSTSTREATEEIKWGDTYKNHPLTPVDTTSKLDKQPNQEIAQNVSETQPKNGLNG
jgi:hypothetical protein